MLKYVLILWIKQTIRIKECNSRFKGSTDGKLLLLDYNDHNIPYYIKNEQSNKMELNKKKILLQCFI
jgi:hypothetical protein